jgi:hypothetical protein
MKSLDAISNGRGTEALPRISYKIKEAAAIAGVSPATIRRAIERGLIKPCRAFRHPLIPVDQLTRLINGQ